VRGDPSGLGRSGAIIAAFTVAVAGYAWYLLEGVFSKKGRPAAKSRATAL
jgi:hypothetical protein